MCVKVQQPAPRPKSLCGVTDSAKTSCGTLFVTFNGSPAIETFPKMGSQGSCTSSFMSALGKVLSIALSWGVPAAAFVKPLQATSCPKHDKLFPTFDVVDGDIIEGEEKRPCCIAALGALINDNINNSEEPVVSYPEEADAKTRFIPSGCGRLAVNVASINGIPSIVSAETAAPGSCAAAITVTLSRCISIALLLGVPAAVIGKELIGIGCHQPKDECLSCIDGIGLALLGKKRERGEISG